MTVARVWNGSAWEVIAGGVSQAQFDAMNSRLSAVEAHPVANQPTLWKRSPNAGSTSASFAAGSIEPFGNAARDMRIGPMAPTRNCWVEVGYRWLVGPTDAAWVRCDSSINLVPDATSDTSKNDELGNPSSPIWLQYWNSAAGTWATVAPVGVFKLLAGQTYWARPIMARSSGTWTYYTGSGYFWGWSKVVGFY